MSKVKFCFGIHNHQPVGNFGWVVEDAYRKSYLPFLQLLERHEFFRISLHCTGILYDWMKQNHPEGLTLIGKLVDRGQVELLTGGFYEPILPIIPDSDKLGQIERQTEFIQKEFGVTPTGLWLAERVWEPQLPTPLRRAGIEYTILDDIHFRFAGLDETELDGYYLTEDQGNKIAVFPISRKLRYTIPFADPEETIDYLKSLADDSGASLGIYADDGEKFGVWPETYKHCYEDKWLERFFAAVEQNLDWIEMVTFGEALNQTQPRGLTYLPTASYSEMNEWALPAKAVAHYDKFRQQLKDAELYDDNIAFVKGGFWRNFLSKYPETNHLHKKMLSISRGLEQQRDDIDPAVFEQTRTHLYAGQCNCPYWHGVFGGLYLPHLRGAVMQELVAAEKLLQRQLGGDSIRVVATDFDCDGNDELLVHGEAGMAIVAPARGGSIMELDFYPVEKNLVDVVARRREGYHHKLLEQESDSRGTKSIHDMVRVKEDGLEKLLAQDAYCRGLFIDHLLSGGTSADQLQHNQQQELFELPSQCYQVISSEASSQGAVFELKSENESVQLLKCFRFNPDVSQVVVEYKLTNQSEQRVTAQLAPEFAFGGYPFPTGESSLLAGERDRHALDSINELADVKSLLLHSRLYNFGVIISSESLFRLLSYPLYTVSLSEAGFEKIYQGLILLPAWNIDLAKGEEFKVGLTLAVLEGSESDLKARLKSHVSEAAP